MVPYTLVCAAVNFFVTSDIASSYRQQISQQIKINRQRNEFEHILNSLPQGLLLARIKEYTEIRD